MPGGTGKRSGEFHPHGRALFSSELPGPLLLWPLQQNCNKEIVLDSMIDNSVLFLVAANRIAEQKRQEWRWQNGAVVLLSSLYRRGGGA